MLEVPQHKYTEVWYEDMEIKVNSIEGVRKNMGDRLFRPHNHDFHQFIFVEEGQGSHEIDFTEFPMQAGEVIPVLVGQIHSHVGVQDIRGTILLFTTNFFTKGTTDNRLLFDFLLLNAMSKPHGIQCDAELKMLLQLLKECYQQKNTFDYEEKLRIYLRLILLKVKEARLQESPILNPEHLDICLKFNEILERRVNYQLKIRDICDEMFIDKKKLSAILQKTVKKAPKEILIERLVLELKRLLCHSELSIKEIAFKMGFSDMANFSNFFKKQVQQTPSVFRKKAHRV